MRTVRVYGVSLVGTEADLVAVEARFEPSDKVRTQLALSGLPDAVIRESRGRLLAALEANQLHVPNGRLFLNLSPAGLRKGGEALDLPLALGAAAACGHLTQRSLQGTLFLGELGIDGALRAVPGGFAAAEGAGRQGIRRVVAAGATAVEAACLPGVEALAARDLAQVVGWLATREGLARARPPRRRPRGDPPSTEALERIRGQATGKHALSVAAAGGHGLLMLGPPGIGKTLLARALIELLPPPELGERLEITRILSSLGRWPGGLAEARPFRAPHHTTSHAGLIGGGSPPRAGEITLAHRGVLFLDELPEFRREALEGLRQPLEAGSVRIARAARSVELPARFHLVCAANPCPCGYRGHGRVPCRCSQAEVHRYRRRISGPLLDRIDLRIELVPPSLDELSSSADPAPPPATGPAARVRSARERMRARQGEVENAELDTQGLDEHAPLSDGIRTLLTRAGEHRELSARAVQSLRRVARTLADLQGREEVTRDHVAEALALRAPLF